MPYESLYLGLVNRRLILTGALAPSTWFRARA